MLKYFVPTKIVEHYQDVGADFLLKNNYKMLLCDIDNTLVGHDIEHATDEVKEYLASISAAGIQVVLISNNTTKRVEKFSKPLGYPYYAMALKPFPFTYQKIKKDFKNIKKAEILALGDQVLTDVLGANLWGIDVILMQQLETYDSNITSFNRMFENLIIKRLKKTSRWPNE